MEMFKMKLDKKGKKIKVPVDPSDPKPVEVAADLKRPETQDERIRRIIAEQIRPQDHGYETEDESNDLEVEDDPDFMGELPLTEAEFNYIKQKDPDIVDEILQPNSGNDSPEQSQTGKDAEVIDSASLSKKEALSLAKDYYKNKGSWPSKFMERTGILDEINSDKAAGVDVKPGNDN